MIVSGCHSCTCRLMKTYILVCICVLLKIVLFLYFLYMYGCVAVRGNHENGDQGQDGNNLGLNQLGRGTCVYVHVC